MIGLLAVAGRALAVTVATISLLFFAAIVVLMLIGLSRDAVQSVRIRRARRRFTREAFAEAQRRQRACDAAGPVDGDAWASALGQSSFGGGQMFGVGQRAFAVDKARMWQQVDEMLHPSDGGQR